MQMFLNKIGVENLAIKGYVPDVNNAKLSVLHIWNLVKLDDKWYHLDVTFDDVEVKAESKEFGIASKGIRNMIRTEYSYRYFLISDKSIEITHTWDRELYPKANSDLLMPKVVREEDFPKATIKDDRVFVDIDDSKYHKEILELASNGIINGVGKQKFAPYNKLNRAEFVEIIVKGLNLSTDEPDTTFKDVGKDKWYFNSVSIASGLGLVKGKGNGIFSPTETISRQEVFAVLDRTIDLLGLDLEGTGVSEERVNDIHNASDWALVSILNMSNIGVLEKGSIDVSATPNRDETVSYIYKLLKNSNRL